MRKVINSMLMTKPRTEVRYHYLYVAFGHCLIVNCLYRVKHRLFNKIKFKPFRKTFSQMLRALVNKVPP